MKIYHTATQEDYDELMIELEEKGYKWLSGNKPTYFNYWKRNKENSCIGISSKGITRGHLELYKKQYPDTPIIEYKAKGDKQMLNPECKHCHKKWHQDSAKYCSWCGNKLVSEPKFKVGDYVTVYVNSKRKTAKIEKIDELVENNSKVHGLWYDRTLVNFKQDYWYLSGLNEFRHATPEEIAEYESALTFHEHGRKPFDVRKGDILGYDEGNIFFVEAPSIWKKERFTSGRFTFLKTAEEVNEWLGADDE